MNKLHLFFARLKTAFIAHKAFAIVPATSISSAILDIFIKQGIIFGVEAHGSNNYKVIFNYNFPFLALKGYKPRKQKTFLCASQLRAITCPFAIVSTNTGLRTLQEVQKLKIGGILICTFEFITK